MCDWQHRDTKENVDAGRLWRVTWTGAGAAPSRPAWWQPIAVGEKSEASLASLLDGLAHPAMSVRMTAQRALAARSDDATRVALRTILTSEKAAPAARMHALWALDASDAGVSARGVNLFLDSSVVLAACGSATGASRAIFDATGVQAWTLETSRYVLNEVAVNLPTLPPSFAKRKKKWLMPFPKCSAAPRISWKH